MKKLLQFCIVLTFGFVFLSAGKPVEAQLACGWDSHSGGDGIKYCVTGFETKDELWDHYFDISCTSNCGSTKVQNFLGKWFGGETHDTSDFTPFQDVNGKWGTCFVPTGGFDSSVTDTYESCVNPTWEENASPYLECIAIGGFTVAGALLSGGASLPIQGGVITGYSTVTVPVAIKAATYCTGGQIAFAGAEYVQNQFKNDIEKCFPSFQVDVRQSEWGPNQSHCSTPLEFSTSVELTDQISQEPFDPTKADIDQFSLCNQISGNQPEQREACLKCTGGSADAEENRGVWTAVGCINRDPQEITSQLIQIGLGVAGGVSLLTFLAAGLIFSVSQGDPKEYGKAKDMMTAAIVGLLFIIFSVTILQFIGYSILKIPGFGG